MNQVQIKVAILLLAMLSGGTFFLAVGNEIDLEDLRSQVAISDSLQHEAQEGIADIAVTIAKYESYLALYGRSEVEVWAEPSDSLLAEPSPIENDSSLWWILPIAWLVCVVLISLFFRGASSVNREYDKQMDEQLEDFRGQD